MNIFHHLLTRCLLLICICLLPQQVFAWKLLEKGLWIDHYLPENTPSGAVRGITILRIDPDHFHFKLFTSSGTNHPPQSLQQWSEQFDLAAAINASMFLEDGTTSTGFMKSFGHINNSFINSRFGAFLAFNPKDDALPQIQIIDRYHQDWKSLISQYETVIQNFRMVSLQQQNVWSKSTKRYSIACIGMDKQGRVLFMYTRDAYSVYEFNSAILKAGYNIRNIMYVEGGSLAALYVENNLLRKNISSPAVQKFLRYNHRESHAIPNAIGIVRK